MYVTPADNAIEAMMTQHQTTGDVLLVPEAVAAPGTGAESLMPQMTPERVEAQQREADEMNALYVHDVSGYIANTLRPGTLRNHHVIPESKRGLYKIGLLESASNFLRFK